MHTLSWLAWLGAALVVTALTDNPLYLLLVLLAATLVFVAWRDTRPLARAYRLFLLGGLALWAGYLFFSVVTVGGARGQTVLVRLPALALPPLLGGVTLGGPITAEDLAWGAARGLRIWTLLVVFGSFNALVDHYRLLRLAPRSLFHAGLVVTIAVTFVPQLLRAISETREAQQIRGHRFTGLRSYAPLVAPLLAGSLERSIQLAEALDARGYGRTRAADLALGRQQLGVLAGLLLVCAGLFVWFYYGSAAGTGGAGLLVAGALLLLLAMRALGQLVPRTTYRRERWRRRDSLAALALAGAVIGSATLHLLGAGGLRYNPYPLISAPPFDPLAGLLICLLAAPALANLRLTIDD
ncbi:MAG: energy-coupling factor transporter transmembrane component T [Roseiflexaceae bacterium]